ncbi:MAG: hypothetical protein ACRDCA_20385 [Serratia sp. (in: enterobacteria)]|uniref:hypothetical protein n=1 Tax=Serratia sp. (in: enterobacteria) TaxID=616 RepID=UPI003F3FD7DF
MNRIFIATILAGAVLVGCDSSEAANNSEFTKAIDGKISKRCHGVFPLGMYATPPFVVSNSDTLRLDKLNAYAKAGVFSVEDNGNGQLKYSLTAEGKKYSKGSGFCVGYRNVNDIVDFTKPADFFGVTMTKVKYTYVVKDIPKWVESIPDVYDALNKPEKASMELYLQKSGWTANKP